MLFMIGAAVLFIGGEACAEGAGSGKHGVMERSHGTVLKGITVRQGETVSFRTDGSVRKSAAQVPAVGRKAGVNPRRQSAGITVRPGERVSFRTDGTVRRQRVADEGGGASGQVADSAGARQRDQRRTVRITRRMNVTEGITVVPGGRVSFRTDGSITRTVIGEGLAGERVQPVRRKPQQRRKPDIMVADLEGGVTVVPGERVSFRTDGSITRTVIEEEMDEKPARPIRKRPPLRRKPDIMVVELSGGVRVEQGETVSFRTDGSTVRRKIEAEPVPLPVAEEPDILVAELGGGVKVEQGETVSFHRDGKITRRMAADPAAAGVVAAGGLERETEEAAEGASEGVPVGAGPAGTGETVPPVLRVVAAGHGELLPAAEGGRGESSKERYEGFGGTAGGDILMTRSTACDGATGRAWLARSGALTTSYEPFLPALTATSRRRALLSRRESS